MQCTQPAVNLQNCAKIIYTEVSWKERTKDVQQRINIPHRNRIGLGGIGYLPPNLSNDATSRCSQRCQRSNFIYNLCWLTILCAGLQLTGPVFIPVGMCVGVHERYIRVPHSAPSCPHRKLGGRLRLTSSCTFPPEILLLAVVVGPASTFTTCHSNLTPALPSHPAEITLCIYSLFSCIVFVLHLVLCPLSWGLVQSKSSLKLFSPVSCVCVQ